jgi:hypothetical protein
VKFEEWWGQINQEKFGEFKRLFEDCWNTSAFNCIDICTRKSEDITYDSGISTNRIIHNICKDIYSELVSYEAKKYI